jgi:hypothetical protein
VCLRNNSLKIEKENRTGKKRMEWIPKMIRELEDTNFNTQVHGSNARNLSV